jgi:hypothetical protein
MPKPIMVTRRTHSYKKHVLEREHILVREHMLEREHIPREVQAKAQHDDKENTFAHIHEHTRTQHIPRECPSKSPTGLQWFQG